MSEPSKPSVPSVFFSDKFHSHCVEKQAWLTKGEDKEWLDLSSLHGCPESISYNGVTYNYQGISDGRAFYNAVGEV